MALLIALLGAVLFTGAATADEAKKPTLRWFGQSFFELTTSQAPASSSTRTRSKNTAADGAGRPGADLAPAQRPQPARSHRERRQGQGRQRRDRQGPPGSNGTWSTRSSATCAYRTVGTYHDTTQGMERGKNAVFVLDVDGLRIVFLGDLGHMLTPGQVEANRPGGRADDPGRRRLHAQRLAKRNRSCSNSSRRSTSCRCTIGTKVVRRRAAVDEFLEDQKNIKRFPTNKLELDPDFKPASPLIAILNWK